MQPLASSQGSRRTGVSAPTFQAPQSGKEPPTLPPAFDCGYPAWGPFATSNGTPLRILYTYITLYWAQTYCAKAVALPIDSGEDCALRIYSCEFTLCVWTGWQVSGKRDTTMT